MRRRETGIGFLDLLDQVPSNLRWMIYLDANLLVHTCLSFLDLFLELLKGSSVGGGTVGFQHLDISVVRISIGRSLATLAITHSSLRGVIFFSGTSSSAKFFWYFSQLEPVALGILRRWSRLWFDEG